MFEILAELCFPKTKVLKKQSPLDRPSLAVHRQNPSTHPRGSDYSVAKEPDGFPSESTFVAFATPVAWTRMLQTPPIAGRRILALHPVLSTGGGKTFLSPRPAVKLRPTRGGGILSSVYPLSTAVANIVFTCLGLTIPNRAILLPYGTFPGDLQDVLRCVD